MIVPFGEDEIDGSMSEATVLYLGRLRHTVDRTVFETELALVRAARRRAIAADEADTRSRDRNTRRDIERTVPTMTPEDVVAIHKIAIERKCSGIEAAVELGKAREAAKADQQ
jgi:hypothetical protein